MYEPNRVERDEQQPAAGIEVKEGRSGDLEIVMTRLWNSAQHATLTLPVFP